MKPAFSPESFETSCMVDAKANPKIKQKQKELIQ